MNRLYGVKKVEDLKKLYKKLSKEYHPDMVGGDTSAFIKLQDLYNCRLIYLEGLDYKVKRRYKHSEDNILNIVER